MRSFALVFVGSGLGGVLRYAAGLLGVRMLGAAMPWATLAVNTLGSFLAVLVLGIAAQRTSFAPELRVFLTVGVLGGFTTYSAFNAEAVGMLQAGRVVAGVGYVVGTVVLCLAAGALAALVVRTPG